MIMKIILHHVRTKNIVGNKIDGLNDNDDDYNVDDQVTEVDDDDDNHTQND